MSHYHLPTPPPSNSLQEAWTNHYVSKYVFCGPTLNTIHEPDPFNLCTTPCDIPQGHCRHCGAPIHYVPDAAWWESIYRIEEPPFPDPV